jgi:hypothetical protein
MLSDEAVCRTLLAEPSVARVKASIAAGRIRVDPAQAQNCITAIRGNCALDMVPEACRNFVVANQAEGEACGDAGECTTQICTAGPGQCGECTQRANVGEACSQQVPCVEPAQCDQQTNLCVAGTPKVGTGEACASSAFDSAGNCANTTDLCINDLCTTVPVVAAGEACGETANGLKLCQRGALCINEICTAGTGNLGDTCMVPDGDDGQTKRSLLCPFDSRCDRTSMTCVSRVADGEACTSSTACQRSSYCADRTTCTAKKDIDEDCRDNEECLSGVCLDEGCVAAVAPECN